MKTIVSVVAGGWSLTEVDHAKIPGFVIGINDSAAQLGRKVDAMATMDRMWAEGRWGWLAQSRTPAYMRKAALKNLPWMDTNGLYPWLHPVECDHTTAEFSKDWTKLNGDHSGYLGLGLAYLMHPDELYLFGFDFQLGPKGQRHWFKEYPWQKGPGKGSTSGYKFGKWNKDMRTAQEQFKAVGTEVINVNTRSKIDAFKIVSPKELGFTP